MRPVDDAERRNVPACSCAPAQQGEPADADKLVDQDGTGHKNLIFHGDISGEEGAVGEDDPVTKLAVVGHMRLGHQEVVISDAGFRSLLRGPMDRRVFANLIAISDPGRRDSSLEGVVLGLVADDRPHVDTIVFSHDHAGSDRHPFKENRPVPDPARTPEDTIRTDCHVGPEFDLGIQNR